MTQSCVSAFARAARVVVLAAVVSGLGAASLLAQGTTGKIEGTVRDQAGAPIANAQVFIVGTTFSATSNNDGYYFINNVPVGTVTVQASFIGYKATQVAGVRILDGTTLTQDVTLEATPFEVEEITVIAAINPLVPRDEVTTKQRVDGDYTKNLPVDRVARVLALQPGVSASNSGNTLFIRGGRADENVLYIDGVPAQAGSRNDVGSTNSSSRAALGSNPGVNTVSVAGFESASITTGAASAEFGNAQSGLVAVTTRSGGSAWSGSLSYETDELFSTNTSYGINRVVGSISGPIAGGVTFFLGGDIEGRQSAQPGMDREKNPIFVQAGVDTVVNVPSVIGDPLADTSAVEIQKWAVYTGTCDEFTESTNSDIAGNFGFDCRGIREPGTTRSSFRFNTNLNWSYGTGSRIKVSAIFRRNQLRHDQFQTSPSNPAQTPGDLGENRIFTLNWTQNLSKSAERALALEVGLSYQEDRFLHSFLTRESEASTYTTFGGFMIGKQDFLFDRDNFPIDEQLVANFKSNIPQSRRVPYDIENTDQYRTASQFRTNPYGLLQGPLWSTTGGPSGRMRVGDENRIVGRATLDWQFDRFNRVKLGGEYIDYDITAYSHSLVSQAFSTAYMQKPIRWNAFLQDRLDLGDVVLEGGVRYDWYDSKAERPFLLDTTAVSPTFGQYVFFPRTASYLGVAPNGDSLTVFRRDQSHGYLSPHIQVSFPVTRTTNFRLSYAHQVQQPDFALVYAGLNTDLGITNTNNTFGSDLDFGKTITFEFGIRHSFSPDAVLDISAYNKDNLSNAAGRLVSLQDPLLKRAQDIRLMTNADFGNTKGVDVRYDRRFGNLFNGTLAYTFQDAQNTGSDPFTFIDFGSRIINQVLGGNIPPPQATLPTDQSRPHNLAGSFALNFPNDWKQGTGASWLENACLYATFRFAIGTAFTRCPSESGKEFVLSGQVCSRVFEGDVNGARLPLLKQFDLRATKGFGLGGVDVTAYLDIRNLFNFKNTTRVYAVTNDVNSGAALDEVLEGDLDGLSAEALQNGALAANGDINLPGFNGARPLTGSNPLDMYCADWVDSGAVPSSPGCIYLVRAEERYGNGDRLFTIEEQTAASTANFNRTLGLQRFTGPGRDMRVGIELNF